MTIAPIQNRFAMPFAAPASSRPAAASASVALDAVDTDPAGGLLESLRAALAPALRGGEPVAGFGQAAFRPGALQIHQATASGASAATGANARATMAGLALPTITTPPSPRGVAYYTGIDRGQGTVGVGQGLKNWLDDVLHAFTRGPANNAAAQLGTSKGVLQDTMRAEARNTDAAMARDIEGGAIMRLNQMSGHQVVKLLDKYEKDSQAVATGHQSVKAARARFDGAGARLDAATARLGAHEQGQARADLAAERSEISARMAGGGATLKTALSIASDFVTNPAGALKKHGWDQMQKAAIAVMNDGDRARLVDIGSKIAVVDQQLAGSVDTSVRKDLEAAKAELVAARHDLVKANLQLAGARDNRWRTVDSLAALEQTYSKSGSTAFRAMQSYFSNVSHMGKTVHGEAQTFIETLQAPPFGDAGKGSTRMSASEARSRGRAHAQTFGQRDPRTYGEVARRAGGIASYAASVDKWASSEIARHESLQTRIEGGAHLDYTGRAFADINKQVFGATLHQPHNRYGGQ